MTSPANELPNAAVDTQISALNGSRKSAPVDITKGYLRNYFLDQAYDEMFDADGKVRPHYRLLLDTFSGLPEEELARRKHSVDIVISHPGHHLHVYGHQEGTERIFPYDMLPRIITGAEWQHIEKGLTQRITALNLFLTMFTTMEKFCATALCRARLFTAAAQFRREMRGLQVPRNVYITVTGTDLLRLSDGEFVVLEDNLRVPSGVSYMLTSRRVMKRTFPQTFRDYGVRPIEHYPQVLLEHAALAGSGGAAGALDRAADPGRLQLGLFRAHLPGSPDGHRAGRRSRPGHPRQHRLHAYHGWPEARGRDLSPRRRRLHRSAGISLATRFWALPACSMPTAPAM